MRFNSIICLFTYLSIVFCHPHDLKVIYNVGGHTTSEDHGMICVKVPEDTTGDKCVSDCEGVEDGDYQSCTDCKVYVTCSNGYAHLNRPCASTLTWDDNKRHCAYYSKTCTGAGFPILNPAKEGYLSFNISDSILSQDIFEDNAMNINIIGITNGEEDYGEDYNGDEEAPQVDDSEGGAGEEAHEHKREGVAELNTGCRQAAGFEVRLPECVKRIEFEYDVSVNVHGSFFIFDDIEMENKPVNKYNVSVVGISFDSEIGFVFQRENMHNGVLFDYPYGKICGTIEQGKVTLSNRNITMTVRSSSLFTNFSTMKGITVMFNVEFFGMRFVSGACGFKLKYSC